jgi:glutaredoxin
MTLLYFCTKAKGILDTSNVKYSEILLDQIENKDRDAIVDCIYGGEKVLVPVVYLNSEKVGGCSELISMQKEGNS